VELGSGCGVISMVLAARCDPASVVAVEVQRGLHEIAVMNVEQNGLGGVVDCVNADYRDFASRHRCSFDAAIANPPFYASGRGRVPSDPERAAAHHEMNGTLRELIDAALLVLVPGGRFTVVFPDSRRIELMEEALRRGFEARRIARGGSPGSKDALILAEFVSRAGL
ncbi:MAG TPA: methyltransferase, partial [bacterium]|nr:methyltransferase [bacterium]